MVPDDPVRTSRGTPASRRRARARIRSQVLAVCGALLLAACEEPAPEAATPPAPPEVRVAYPVSKPIVEWDVYTGRFEAIERVEIRARVSGYLESISFEDGQLVEAGDLLFVIDQRPFRLAEQAAQAELDVALAQQEFAAGDLQRAQNLRSSRTMAQDELDRRLAEARGTRARVESARAALAQAKLNLEFTEIRAPISGRIGRELVTPGNLVDGSDSGGTVLTTIVSQNPIYFYFEASESDYLKYNRLSESGQRPSSRDAPNPVAVKLLDETEFVHHGHMNFVDNVIDPNSGTILARAVIENPGSFLQPGQFGRLRLPGSGEYQAVLIPDAAVQSDQSRKFVYTVTDEDLVERKWITLGPFVDGLRVVRSGLSADERIVIGGLQRVRAGAEVTPLEEQIQPAEAAPPAAGD